MLIFILTNIILASILLFIGVNRFEPSNVEVKEFSFNEFMDNVKNKQVARVEYNTKDTKINTRG